LSYPLYITHYPLIYIYTSWVVTSNPTGAQGVLAALLLAAVAIGIAYASLKLYDEPVPRWLSKRWPTTPAEPAMPDPGEK
jgi:peptidoglycan/LPS O-acetylase OafA/YrhL